MLKRLVLLLILCSTVFAANEIYYVGGDTTSGFELCAVICQPSTDYLWDDVNGFESTMPDAHSGIDLTESSNTKGRYYGTFPASIPAEQYDIFIYDSNSTNLDFNDTQLSAYEFNWNGSAEITLYDILADTNDIQEDWAATLTNIADIETDTAAVDTTSEMRTFLTGGDTAVSTVTTAQVNTECDNAIITYNLDHWMKVTVDDQEDVTDEVADGTLLSFLITINGDTSTWNEATDNFWAIYEAILTAAETEAEVEDALQAMNLDHLLDVAVADGNDMTEIVDNSIFAFLLSGGDSNDFDFTTDSIMDIRDLGYDIQQTSGSGGY